MFITVSGRLPPGKVVPRQKAPWWLSSGKVPPRKVTLFQQFLLRQIPQMITSSMIAHKESCSWGNLSNLRTIGPEENCSPPVQLLPKKIFFEENSQTVATMNACFRTILHEENSLEGNCPHPIQSSKIIPNNEYSELTGVHYVLLRVERFELTARDSWFTSQLWSFKFEIWKFEFHLKVFRLNNIRHSSFYIFFLVY